MFQLSKFDCKLYIQRSGFIFLGKKLHNTEGLYLKLTCILNHIGNHSGDPNKTQSILTSYWLKLTKYNNDNTYLSIIFHS